MPIKKETSNKHSSKAKYRRPFNANKSPHPKTPIWKPKTSGRLLAVRKPPLLLQVRAAAKFFEKLSAEYATATEGYRAKLYEFAARCYAVGLGFIKHPDQFARFKENPFWADARQKPKDDKIMRSVLDFAMKARSAKLASRITKTAKVLDSMAEKGIKPGEVAKRLKEGGGILKMYADLSPNRRDNGRVPDDLEILNPNVGEDDEDHEDEEGADDKSDRKKADSWGEDQEANPNADDPDTHPRHSQPLASTTGKWPTITDFGGIATPPPKSPAYKFDPNRDLGVDLSEVGLSPISVRAMKKVRIVAEIEEPEDGDWWVCKALSVEAMHDEDEDDDGWPKTD